MYSGPPQCCSCSAGALHATPAGKHLCAGDLYITGWTSCWVAHVIHQCILKMVVNELLGGPCHPSMHTQAGSAADAYVLSDQQASCAMSAACTGPARQCWHGEGPGQPVSSRGRGLGTAQQPQNRGAQLWRAASLSSHSQCLMPHRLACSLIVKRGMPL